MKKIINSALIAIIGGVSGVVCYQFAEKKTEPSFTDTSPKTEFRFVSGSTPEGAVNFQTAAEVSVHSVVHIKTMSQGDNFSNSINDPFRDFFGPYRGNPQPMMGSGSGVIISENGYIATNNHVVNGADKIEVTLNNNKTYTAEVIGKDPTTDLALLKIDEKGLSFLNYGNSDEVKVGEWVLAVGNPFNLTSTVTAGIISAKGRNINILENNPEKGMFPIESFIQTDAAVNPGNSGGALVNTKGELVGINSAIASNTGSYSGYSFAVPVNIVKKVMNDLLEFGTVQRGFLGVYMREIDSKLAEERSIKEYKGVYVSGLVDGGSAELAGIKEGDVIMKIGDVAVNNSPELQEQVGKYRPGDKVNISLARLGKLMEIPVVLKNKNGNTDVVKKEKVESINVLGATFIAPSAEEMKKLRINNGLKVMTLSNGKLKNAGIREGFIITHVDKKPISSVQDISNILDNKTGGVLMEGIYPNGLRAYYGFGL